MLGSWRRQSHNALLETRIADKVRAILIISCIKSMCAVVQQKFGSILREASKYTLVSVIIIVCLNQHIILISERSRDWRLEKCSALHHRNKWYFTIFSHRKQLFYIVQIFHNITVFTIFDHLNTALVSIRDFIKINIIYSKLLTNALYNALMYDHTL